MIDIKMIARGVMPIFKEDVRPPAKLSNGRS